MYHFFPSRIFGVVLIPTDLFTCSSLFHLLWNSFVYVIVIRDLCRPSYYHVEQIRADIRQTPFFFQLYRYSFEWSFVFSYISTTTYYLLMLPKMFPLLDSPPISTYYQAKGGQQIALLIAIFALVDLTTFFGFHVNFFQSAFKLHQMTAWKVLVNELALIGEFIYTYLPFCIACYTQLGTLSAVQKIEEKVYQKDCSRQSLFQIKRKIGEIANANSRLHQLNSPPLAIYLVTTGVAIVVNVCRQVKADPDYGFFLYGLLICVYQSYLASLSRRTKVAFQRIVKSLPTNEKLNEKLQSSKNFKIGKREERRANAMGTDLLETYKTELGIQVFKLFTFDFSFQFSFVLLLLNYTVFILQTKATE